MRVSKRQKQINEKVESTKVYPILDALTLLKEIPNGYFISPRKIDIKSDNNDEEVGPGPAPSPCKTLSPTGLPSVITAFITPLTLPMYVFLLTRHGCTVSNN